ncbi:zinc ABC transporter substrate-binding protein ZnuA [Azospirillum isscasi]|uniref:High-affinity zinc uptake system protein ZnuA n=1 Tax=Azospirillum isscasi TaxID=3053926 RepID=A0ABU0WLE6_9PROT|nr:zinc ABC transporter substrate-binding protein ZnuA [Azospirillum isscasi]MDQ2105059.1 zinc ABC transporter substrate-binding protein ZnuA [Azospirillum isscasi]
MRPVMRHLPPSVVAAILLAASPALADAPKVVASIKPVHSLVAAVMEGVAEPALIVRGAASPHTYAMKPSDAKALAAADLVFWVGPELESFLDKPLKANAKKATSVELLEAPGVTLLDAREGGAWEAHDHGHKHDHGHAHGEGHGHEEVNTHVWLDPANARAMVAAIAEALSAKDPANAAAYTVNAGRTARSIDALDAELKAALAPVAGKPFVVFHDAYQYFEAHYGLNGVGAITVNPERRPSAKRLSEIRARITGLGAACVFAEPQFEPALVDTIVDGTRAKKGVLDPEGAELKDGPGLYPALMRGIAASLKDCLGS